MTSFQVLRARMLADPNVRREYDRLKLEGFCMEPPAGDDGSDGETCDECGATLAFSTAIGIYCPSPECSILHHLKADPDRPDFLVADDEWEEPGPDDDPRVHHQLSLLEEQLTEYGTRLESYNDAISRLNEAVEQAQGAIGNLVHEINRLDDEREHWWVTLWWRIRWW
jgi:hypothetical protein